MYSFPAAFAVAIGPVDSLIVVAYLLATTLFGVMLGRGQADNRDFFLGGHRLPTWALLVSIVATETSTVTFLSVPGKSYVEGGSFAFLQIAFGNIPPRSGFRRSVVLLIVTWAIVAAIFFISVQLAPDLIEASR